MNQSLCERNEMVWSKFFSGALPTFLNGGQRVRRELPKGTIGLSAGFGLAVFVAFNAFRSFRYFSQCTAIDPPRDSIFYLSAQDRENGWTTQDCFEVHVPKREFRSVLAKEQFSDGEGLLLDFVRAFFHSPLFSVEQYVLCALFQRCLAPTVRVDTFPKGRCIGIWTVVERKRNEISFEWKFFGAKGRTNFGVQKGNLQDDGNDAPVTVRFGSQLHGVTPAAPMMFLHNVYSTVLLAQAAGTIVRMNDLCRVDWWL